jgi:MarR family transcriptional regulator for hemolysin
MDKRQAISRGLTGALVRATRRYRLASDLRLRALGLSDATALPVMMLHRLGDGVRQGVLAEEMGVEGPSLVRLIDQLQGLGFVERVEDPSDRRARLLNLTPAGRHHAGQAEAALDDLRADLFAGASEADLETALALLGRVAEALARLESVEKP